MPNAGDYNRVIEDRIKDLAERHEALSETVHGRITALDEKFTSQLGPITSRQNRVQGVIGVVALITGAIFTKILDALTGGAAHH